MVFVRLPKLRCAPTSFPVWLASPIERPGEPLWSEATQGLKQNELIWAISTDGGASWSDPQPIAKPTVGSVEAAGPICVTRSGRWLAVYSPYNSFDPQLVVPRNQVVILRSDDEGQSWQHTAMLRFPQPGAGGAESWVAELSDGRLVGTAWNVDLSAKTEFPNVFALSCDGGISWSPTRSTGVMGQSTALCAYRAGRVLFVYNQRRHGEPGVWLAVARPTEATWESSIRKSSGGRLRRPGRGVPESTPTGPTSPLASRRWRSCRTVTCWSFCGASSPTGAASASCASAWSNRPLDKRPVYHQPTGDLPLKRYPSCIMATCCIPWDDSGRFAEAIFRRGVRRC